MLARPRITSLPKPLSASQVWSIITWWASCELPPSSLILYSSSNVTALPLVQKEFLTICVNLVEQVVFSCARMGWLYVSTAETPRSWKPGKLFNGFIMTLLGWHMHPVGFHYCCFCFKFCSGLNCCLDHINSIPSLWEEAITDLIALFFFFQHKCISNWFQIPNLLGLFIKS